MDSANETNEHAIDLLDKLLVLDPNSRVSAGKMLEHDYFWSGRHRCPLLSRLARPRRYIHNHLCLHAEPLPKRLENPQPLLPENVSCHEYETKQEAKKNARPRESGKQGASDSKRSRDGHGSMQPGERKRRSAGNGRARLDEHGEIIRDAGFRDSVGAKASGSSGDSERRRSSSSSKPAGGAAGNGVEDSAYDPLGDSSKRPPPSSSDLFG